MEEQHAAHGRDDRIIVAAAQGRVGVSDDRKPFPEHGVVALRSPRVVDPAFKFDVVVNTGDGKRTIRLG